jgi:hypothetical protein
LRVDGVSRYRVGMMRSKQVVSMVAGLAVVLGAGACGKKKDGGGASGGGDVAASNLPPELSAWTPTGAADAWKGVWQTHLSLHTGNLDAPVALEVKGDTATAFDGAADHALTVRFDAPCRISFDEKDGATTWTYSKHFLMQAGKIVAVGDGAAGYRKGKSAIVCKIGSPDLYTLDERARAYRGRSTSWTRRSGSRRPRRARGAPTAARTS